MTITQMGVIGAMLIIIATMAMIMMAMIDEVNRLIRLIKSQKETISELNARATGLEISRNEIFRHIENIMDLYMKQSDDTLDLYQRVNRLSEQQIKTINQVSRGNIRWKKYAADVMQKKQ